MLRQRILSTCGLLLAAVSVFGQTANPGTHTTTTSLPPIGLASTETAQVNVVNTAPPSPTGAPSSCTGSIAFYNASGSIIGSATNFTLGSGEISSVSLPFAMAGATGSRTVIRAVISLTITGNVAFARLGAAVALPPSCALASSLETFDTATGVAHVFFASGSQGFPAVWVGAPVPAR